jgi:hypothetical protein
MEGLEHPAHALLAARMLGRVNQLTRNWSKGPMMRGTFWYG